MAKTMTAAHTKSNAAGAMVEFVLKLLIMVSYEAGAAAEAQLVQITIDCLDISIRLSHHNPELLVGAGVDDDTAALVRVIQVYFGDKISFLIAVLFYSALPGLWSTRIIDSAPFLDPWLVLDPNLMPRTLSLTRTETDS